MRYLINAENLLPHQLEFLTTAKKIKALVSGYGAGKSFAFIRETFKNHINNRNKEGKSNGWIIYPTYDLADEVFLFPPNQDGFLDLLNRAGISYSYNGQKHRLITKYGNIKIYQLQQPKRIVGAELTFVGFDEFDIESLKNCKIAYLKALGRLRGNETSKLFIVTTPEGFKMSYKIFVQESSNDKILIKAKTTDNPYLPGGYIETLKDNYDPQLLKQYLEGEFVNLIGTNAYYSVDRTRHVIDSFIPNDLSILHIGQDFNVNPGTATIGIFENGILTIFDEFYLKNSNTYRMAEVIKAKYPNSRLFLYPDMTGRSRRTSAIETDLDIMVKAGFIIRRQGINSLVKDRLNIVNNAFSKDLVFITKNCTNLIRDYDQVITDNFGEIDKSNQELTHISDAAGYKIETLFPMQPRMGAPQISDKYDYVDYGEW